MLFELAKWDSKTDAATLNYEWVVALAESKKAHLQNLKEITITERDCIGPDVTEFDEWELKQPGDLRKVLDGASITLKVTRRCSKG
jgi:hypothetical protein